MPFILLLVFAHGVLGGIKVALTSSLSPRRNPASAWGGLCGLCLVPLPALGAALSLLLNNPKGCKNPKPFLDQYSAFPHVLGKAGNCGLFQTEAIHRKARISPSSQNLFGSIRENEIVS